jgi:hypothetical protein
MIALVFSFHSKIPALSSDIYCPRPVDLQRAFVPDGAPYSVVHTPGQERSIMRHHGKQMLTFYFSLFRDKSYLDLNFGLLGSLFAARRRFSQFRSHFFPKSSFKLFDNVFDSGSQHLQLP